MKILGITPKNEFTGLTPEEKYLEGLKTLGHEVKYSEQPLSLIENGFIPDVVVAMSEVSCELGFRIAQTIKKPFYAHMEWVPHWRVFYDDEYNWGFEVHTISYAKKVAYLKQYLQYLYFWSNATVKSLAGKCFNASVIDLVGTPLDIETKYLGVDIDGITKTTKKYRDMEKHDEVVCIARFVPHKRVHHIIEAIKEYNERCGKDVVLNLVGYGIEKDFYEHIKGDLKIVYWNSKDKYEALGRSKVCISLWSGLVPAEAALFGCPTITYMSDYMRELYGDTIFYANNNNIQNLSEVLESVIELDCNGRYGTSEHLLNKIKDGEINTLTMNKSLLLLESFINKAVERFNK